MKKEKLSEPVGQLVFDPGGDAPLISISMHRKPNVFRMFLYCLLGFVWLSND